MVDLPTALSSKGVIVVLLGESAGGFLLRCFVLAELIGHARDGRFDEHLFEIVPASILLASCCVKRIERGGSEVVVREKQGKHT